MTRARGVRALFVVWALGLGHARPAAAGPPEIELGLENLYYRTAQTALNRDDRLGLDRHEDLLRGTLSLRKSAGPLRGVFRGYVERSLGGTGDRTRWTTREAYAQYRFGEGLSLRIGKQRIAWGSGFAWNPTNRVEPPKNPLNTGLEQQGTLAVRADWLPTAWASIVLLAARGDTQLDDLPFPAPRSRRESAAVRARFLVADTDLALVFSGGDGQRTLLGLDLGREVGHGVAAHAEAAVYQGAELGAARDEDRFVRLTLGALWTRDDSALSVEYFFNAEGFSDGELAAYLAALDASYARATNPALPASLREQALGRYLSGAALPYSGGLGLRRHYLQASWTRSRIHGEWTAALRGLLGLSDAGVALTPGIRYAPRDDLTLSLDAVVLLGPAQSEYRLAPVRGAVQARLRLLF